ncbi:hypothetical protein [Geodermatophilus ruber]|uniref:hypothetical protein n=1 Tax=Geodermatophilus ruber TaxID=504800 RepID=UPI0011601E2E|nr:hypothetical protein [Geodermatophilus ruber]
MAVRPIQPLELIELADELAGRNSGAGKPKTIRLRRSISSAYYAVFHELSFRATSRLLGSTGWGSTEAAVTRWITHTDLADLTTAVATGTGRGAKALKLALGVVHPDVTRIAQAFVDLQDARHRADYDDTFDVSKAVALSFVDLAGDAVRRSGALIDADDATYSRFLALAMGGVKVARTR